LGAFFDEIGVHSYDVIAHQVLVLLPAGRLRP
jgi:hypothetical protein